MPCPRVLGGGVIPVILSSFNPDQFWVGWQSRDSARGYCRRWRRLCGNNSDKCPRATRPARVCDARAGFHRRRNASVQKGWLSSTVIAYVPVRGVSKAVGVIHDRDACNIAIYRT